MNYEYKLSEILEDISIWGEYAHKISDEMLDKISQRVDMLTLEQKGKLYTIIEDKIKSSNDQTSFEMNQWRIEIPVVGILLAIANLISSLDSGLTAMCLIIYVALIFIYIFVIFNRSEKKKELEENRSKLNIIKMTLK